MRVGVPKEVKSHENRVGLVPAAAEEFGHHGHQVIVESEAGREIGFSDDDYRAAGAEIAPDARVVFDRGGSRPRTKSGLKVAPQTGLRHRSNRSRRNGGLAPHFWIGGSTGVGFAHSRRQRDPDGTQGEAGGGTRGGAYHEALRRTDLGPEGIYYRASIGPFVSMKAAARVCSSLKAAGESCLVEKN